MRRPAAPNAVAVIPARYASTRLPGKPLLAQTSRPLIEHVYRQVSLARSIGGVIVATDDERIASAVRAFGGQVVMTRRDHPSGTDRVAEVAAGLEADIIVNVQGDEPEIDPPLIDRLVEVLASDAEASMATAACPFSAAGNADPSDPSAVKVVVDRRSRALYFSRSVIPYARSGILGPDQRSSACRSDEHNRGGDATASVAGGSVGRPSTTLLHLGVYAYRRDRKSVV